MVTWAGGRTPHAQLPGLRLAATLAAAGLGALWGSFLNVCIVRIPRGMSVVRPASHCFACGKRVWARDNIPILSYLLLRGRCRHCGARFSPATRWSKLSPPRWRP